VHDGEMVPIKDAVYRQPNAYTWRAHFYAPNKYFFNQPIDTFWFNLAFIWLFSFLLFPVLYYDVIRKALAYMETLRLNRLNKLKINRLLKLSEQSRQMKSKM
jgi:hypothetical protein